MQKKLFLPIFFFSVLTSVVAQPRFHALVLFENGGIILNLQTLHNPGSTNLLLTAVLPSTIFQRTDSINEVFLANYQLFIQLDYPPYG